MSKKTVILVVCFVGACNQPVSAMQSLRSLGNKLAPWCALAVAGVGVIWLGKTAYQAMFPPQSGEERMKKIAAAEVNQRCALAVQRQMNLPQQPQNGVEALAAGVVKVHERVKQLEEDTTE